VPGSLLERWILDPRLIVILAAAATLHFVLTAPGERKGIVVGWSIAAFAFVSPICTNRPVAALRVPIRRPVRLPDPACQARDAVPLD